MSDFKFNLSEEIADDEMFDMIIIGGGPAGLTAGLYAARYKLNVLMIEKSYASGGQMAGTEWVENYPGFPEPVLGYQLAQDMENQARSFGLKIINALVDSVDLKKEIKEIKANAKIYRAKTVLITTGASPRSLGIDGEEDYRGRGISYCATCDGPLYPDKNIAVIGGGNSACEESLFLAKYAKTITIYQLTDRLTADSVIIDKVLQNPKIKVVLKSRLEAIDFTNPKNKKIIIRHLDTLLMEEMETDGIFVFIGQHPNTELFKDQLELEHDYIKTDCSLQTSVPGVYAAGDVIIKELRQVATAVGDGALVAYKINKYLENKELLS